MSTQLNVSKLPDIKVIAKQLVIRSRAGDQNASAIIMEVAKSAKAGSPKAIQSNKAIAEYIKTHPVPNPRTMPATEWSDAMIGYISELQSNFSGEAVVALIPLIGDFGPTTLANGPKLRNDIISKIGSEFCSEKERHAFSFGVRNSEESDKIKEGLGNVPEQIAVAVLIGCNVGEAKRIQLVRLPNVPISVLSKQAASELGDL